MPETSMAAEDIKKRQRDDWNAVAAGWEKWWQTLEEGSRHVSDLLLEMAAIQAGQRIMDIATGIGEPAVSAARVVGDSGLVIATDQAPQMLEIAQRRARQQGLTNIRFVEMDGENARFDQHGFDAVLCRWGLMFFPDVDRALARIYALLKPGGKFATAVWSTPDKVPGISFSMNFVRAAVNAPPPPKDMPSPFALADTDKLRQQFKLAGFQDIALETIKVVFTMPSAAEFTAFTKDISAPVVAIVEQQTADRQEEIWQAMTEALGEFEQPDKSIQFENEALCISGTR